MLVYLVSDIVNEPYVVLVVAVDSVRSCELSVPELESVAVWVYGDSDVACGIVGAPHVDEVAFGVEDEKRYVASVEDVYSVVGVDSYGSGFS